MRVANCVHTSSVFAIYAAFFFEPGGRPGPRRRLRRRRTVFAFWTGGVTMAFFRAIFSATAFGGRPGPPGRHFPRALRRRRRPFVVFGLLLETLPSNDLATTRHTGITVRAIAAPIATRERYVIHPRASRVER